MASFIDISRNFHGNGNFRGNLRKFHFQKFPLYFLRHYTLCESLQTHSNFCSLHFVYVGVCLCVQFRCLCKLHFCPAVSFCPLYAFLPLCVFLPSVFLPTVSVKSDLFVSTLLVLFVPTLGVCVYSRRCLRPLCFCLLCVLLVYLFILFHTKTYELGVIGSYCN